MNTNFGEYLKNLRLSNGIKTQRQLALKTGISGATISRLESNIQKPEPDTLKAISNHLFNTTYEELLKVAGYLNVSGETKQLSDKEQKLVLASRKLNDKQIELVLKLMDEMA
jgi:transcriptional regulator with XRE-family HTH domain